jgi:hypothetical protein
VSKKSSKRGTVQVPKSLLVRFKAVAKSKGYGIGFLVESFMQGWIAEKEGK